MGTAFAIWQGFLAALSWVWNHKTLSALIAVSIYCVVLRWGNESLRGEKTLRLAAEKSLASWRVSAEEYADANRILNDRIDTQNTAFNTMAEKKKAAEAFAIAAAAEAVRAQAALNNRTLQWEERAHAHPEDVRQLGPVACDAYRSMYGDAAACIGAAQATP